MKNETDFTEKRNLFITALLIMLILFGIEALFPSAKNETPVPSQNTVMPTQSVTNTNQIVASMPETNTPVNALPQPNVMQTLTIQNAALKGKFNVQQGRLFEAELLKYKETTEKDSPFVKLLHQNYYTQTHWTSTNAVLPTLYLSADNQVLTPDHPIVLTGENEFVKMERKLLLDENYMLSIVDQITNLTNAPISVSFSGEISRKLEELPKMTNVHEGFIAVVKDRLIEEKYTDVEKENISHVTRGGWFGITDKYWQTALILDSNEKGIVQFEKPESALYKAVFTGDTVTVNPAQTYTHTSRTFAGAKTIDLLNEYQNRYHIPKFDLTIDFGWFYFLTKPFLHILNWLYAFLGNMGIAIIIFATLIRALLLPIATKSYESMAKMRKMQPQMQSLQKRFKDDKQRLQIEMMNLYKREKVNPAAGCLPMFLQIPVFYALYKVLSVSIDMRQAPFYGWITDLSAPDPTSVFTGFGYFDWSVPALLNIGILPVLMGLTMVIQQKLSPAPADPTQAKVLKWMPVIFTFMLGGFAAGLVLYWTWSNILSILQQKYIMHKVGTK